MNQTFFFSESELKTLAQKTRKTFLEMHFKARAGHLGSGLSAIDLLTAIYSLWMTPKNHFILSKGHGASALYATLFHHGLLSLKEIESYYRDGTLLPAHPAARALKPIVAATGSLGHGFPIAAGLAYSQKILEKSHGKTACLLSDGECNEGTTWEAAMFAKQHGLSNLLIVIDANGFQGFGKTTDVLSLEPLAEKFKAFGFSVSEINGHNFDEIKKALQIEPDLLADSASLNSTAKKNSPRCVIARTVKGKGVSFMENTLEWHYLPMNESQFAQALKEVQG